MMWSIWNAPSDRDYYEQFNRPEEVDEDPLDAFTADEISLFMSNPEVTG